MTEPPPMQLFPLRGPVEKLLLAVAKLLFSHPPDAKGNATRLGSRCVAIVLLENDNDALSIGVWLRDVKESATFVSVTFGRTNLRVAGAAERYGW